MGEEHRRPQVDAEMSIPELSINRVDVIGLEH
jgi:hypothetical protein